jgi:hypothetical protein
MRGKVRLAALRSAKYGPQHAQPYVVAMSAAPLSSKPGRRDQ